MYYLSITLLILLALTSAQEYGEYFGGYDGFEEIVFTNGSVTKASSNDEIDRAKCDTNEYNCCFVTDTEKCDLSDMERGKATLVFPGFNTRCIHSDKGSFAFQVYFKHYH